jgi:DNA modification methylase
MALRYDLHAGDNLEWLRSLPDCSIDSFVTDPPYGLGNEPEMVSCLQNWIDHGYHEVGGRGFMGKTWDAFVPQPVFWREVYRVLKPGGYVVSFGGTRTYDLMVLAVRLAGFEIRDMLEWIYGSGFPKSHNISKAIDKAAGATREVVGKRPAGKGIKSGSGNYVGEAAYAGENDITVASTDSAKEWDGFGSALKPAHEPILLARKPLEKGLTIAQNVQKWGTGALNIDGARIGTESDGRPLREVADLNLGIDYQGTSLAGRLDGSLKTSKAVGSTSLGRWPSNLLLANVPEVIGLFPALAKSGKMGPNHTRHTDGSPNGIYGKFDVNHELQEPIGDSGSASRYFFRADLLPIEIADYEVLPLHLKVIYCSKPSKAERNLGKTSLANHPTVKAVSLMLHLVTLVTPPNGVCCDPFMGSGTTGIATMLAGPQMQFWGCELTAEYLPISEQRIKNWKHYRQFTEVKAGDSPARVKIAESKAGVQTSLF